MTKDEHLRSILSKNLLRQRTVNALPGESKTEKEAAPIWPEAMDEKTYSGCGLKVIYTEADLVIAE